MAIKTVTISVEEFENFLKAERILQTIAYVHRVKSKRRGRIVANYFDYLDKGQLDVMQTDLELQRAEEINLIEQELKKYEQ